MTAAEATGPLVAPKVACTCGHDSPLHQWRPGEVCKSPGCPCLGYTPSAWEYDRHPGDCHQRRNDGVWTTCCLECAGTGGFPVPWVTTVAEALADPDASCVACKSTGRAIVGLAAPLARADEVAP